MKRIWFRLTLLGLAGTISLLLAPLERLAPVAMDPLAFRLLAIIQPAIFVALAAALGAWAAPKVALDAPAVRAWAEGRPIGPVLRAQLPSAAVAGIAAALVLITFWAVIVRAGLSGPLARIEMPLVTKLLYGGIVEELLLRWGVMSFLVWGAVRLARPRSSTAPPWCYWLGAVLAALLFAAGHLPTLHLLMPEPPSWLVASVFVANAVPGILFGWLYWKRGLEAAMMAHAFAHLFSVAALRLVG